VEEVEGEEVVLVCVEVKAGDEAAPEPPAEVALLRIDEMSMVTGLPDCWQAF
jgi:hypothetical protein